MRRWRIVGVKHRECCGMEAAVDRVLDVYGQPMHPSLGQRLKRNRCPGAWQGTRKDARLFAIFEASI